MSDPPGEIISRTHTAHRNDGSDTYGYSTNNVVKSKQKYDNKHKFLPKSSSYCSDDVTASETDTTDDSTLFYINCPRNHRDDDRDNITIEPHLYQWDREQEERFRRQNDDIITQNDLDHTDESDCKAQIGDFETTGFDDDNGDEWFDERSLGSFTFTTRVSVLGNNDKTRRNNVPVVQAIPVTDSNPVHRNLGSATVISCDPSELINNSRTDHGKSSDKSTCSESLLENMSWLSSASTTLSQTQLLMLRQEGFPLGLSEQLMEAKSKVPIRFWLVDNSGSMRALDGHQLRRAYATSSSNDNMNDTDTRYVSDAFQGMQQAKTYVASCSRWTELQGAVIDHAELSGLLRMPTIFRLLNHPDKSIGKQELSVALPTTKGTGVIDPYTNIMDVVHLLQHTNPEGGTLLTVHLKEIRKRIEQIQSVLLVKGQVATIVIATDGLPTDENGNTTRTAQHHFIEALRSFRFMPVWIVIRLCTDDHDVARYYNELDKKAELPMEVLDDFLGESKEIYRFNPWLNYAMPLHRCREMGFHHRILDILDERALDKDELHQFLKLLFGEDRFKKSPNIHANWKEYKNFISSVVLNGGKLWCPSTGKAEYWIDLKSLSKIYGPQGYFGWTRGRNKEPPSSRKVFGFTFWKRTSEQKSLEPIDESVEVQKHRGQQHFLSQDVIRVRAKGFKKPASPPGRAASTLKAVESPTRTSRKQPVQLDPPASVSSYINNVDYFNDIRSFPPSDDDFSETSSYVEETVTEDESSGSRTNEINGRVEKKANPKTVETESLSDSTIYIESAGRAENYNCSKQSDAPIFSAGNSDFPPVGQIRREESTINHQNNTPERGSTVESVVEASFFEEIIEEDSSVIEESVYEEETVCDEEVEYEEESIE